MKSRIWNIAKSKISSFESHAEWLLAGGITVVLFVNWRGWSKDKKEIEQLKREQTAYPLLEETPRVSILIAAWNKKDSIQNCLEAVLGLRYPNKQVVVCAGGQDNTFAIAKAYENLTVVILEQQAGEGKQRALQRCFEQAKGEIIFLTDADCKVDDECFEQTISAIIKGEQEVVAGAWQPMDEQKKSSFVQYQWLHHICRNRRQATYVTALDGRNAAVGRAALEKAGAFKSEAPIGTDYILSKQLRAAGYKIRFIPESQVQTEYPDTIREYCRQQSRWFRTPFLLGKKRGEWQLVYTQLRAALAAIFLLTVPLIGGLGSKCLWYPWLTIACHLSLSQVRLTQFAEQLEDEWPCRRQIALFTVYQVVSWIAMARGLIESLFSKRRWRW